MQITSSIILAAQLKNTRAYHPGASEEFTGNKLQKRHILNVVSDFFVKQLAYMHV